MNRTLILAAWLIPAACATLAQAADGPILDTPFAQEYRDPFVQGADKAENDVRSVAVSGDGKVWAATQAGLRVVDAGKLVEPAGEKIDGPTYDLLVSKDGKTIAIGAWNGVYLVENGSVKAAPGMNGPVTSLAHYRGRLVAGNHEGIFEQASDGSWKRIPGTWSTPPRDMVECQGDLVVSAWSGVFVKRGQEIDALNDPDEILSRNCRGLAVDKKGHLWVGSRGGIDVYDDLHTEASHTGRDGLPSTDVRLMSFDAEGRLWAATGLGVARFDGKRWSLRHSLRWLPSDDARDVAFAADGAAWVATGNGLGVIRKRSMTLEEKAKVFEDQVRARHVRAPGLVEHCVLNKPGDLSDIRPTDTDNDGLFTGLYVAAESFRYAVTKDPAAKANAQEAYRAIEYLQTVTDTPGFVARTVIPSDWSTMADRNETFTPQQVAERLSDESRWKRVENRWRLSKDGKWLWKGDTSSDEISGHYYAWGIYYDLVADDEEKKRVAAHVKKVTDYIIDGGYVLKDIDGQATRWGVWSPEKLNGDPNWWLERGCNSVEILSFLTVAYHITGDERYNREIDTLLHKHHYDENILQPMDPTPDYFTYIGFHLLSLAYRGLLAYEKDPERRELYLESLEAWFDPVRRDASPMYGITYAAFTDDDEDNYRQKAIAGQFRDVPLDMIEWTVDNSGREDIRIVGKPVEGIPQANRLLPASERGSYRWDRNVYDVKRGSDGRSESTSVFWLLPYWMGRHHGLIAALPAK